MESKKLTLREFKELSKEHEEVYNEKEMNRMNDEEKE